MAMGNACCISISGVDTRANVDAWFVPFLDEDDSIDAPELALNYGQCGDKTRARGKWAIEGSLGGLVRS